MKRYVIFEWGNIKIGLIGICEDWVDTTVPGSSEVFYIDYCETAENLAKKLKEEDKVDIVIALSHNRKKYDRIFGGIFFNVLFLFLILSIFLLLKSLEKVPSVDLNLGGHSHSYKDAFKKSKFVKSGQCFEFLSVITVHFLFHSLS